MPTIGEMLGALEARSFVGRERALADFRAWLADAAPPPGILNVTGPGGVGKSTLLRAFARIAGEVRRPVVWLDGRSVRSTPESFLGTLGGGSLEDIVAALNAAQPVLLVDTFEELADLTAYLREAFLPALDTGVRVVIAGRYPLGLDWSREETWRTLIRPLRLDGFSAEEARAYLAKRELVAPEVVERVLAAAGGHPLALSLAADLVQQFGVRDLAAAPEWHLAVRTLVEQLLRDLQDRSLRELLEAAAVARRFDEATLRAVAGEEAVEEAFDRFCRLSMVRPTQHGLGLHGDVGRILAEDLRWRRPDRHTELRRRALAHYRARMRGADRAERQQLLAAQCALWENTFLQALMFPADDPGRVWIEPASPHDFDDLRQLCDHWFKVFHAPLVPMAPRSTIQSTEQLFEMHLNYPGSRIRVARGAENQALGFSMFVPICRESLPVLEFHFRVPTLLESVLGPSYHARLPTSPDDTDIYCLTFVCHGEVEPVAVQAALLRDLLGVLAWAGIYLTHTPIPAYQQLVELLGWRRVSEARHYLWGTDAPSEGFVLDLRGRGLEGWLDEIQGVGLPRTATAPGIAEADNPVHQMEETLPNGARISHVLESLTPRELEVASLVACGLSNRQLADELVISERTAERHVANIMGKLGFNSRAQIAAWAVRREQGSVGSEEGQANNEL